MNDIPILLNHNYEKVIGICGRDGLGVFDSNQKITRDMLFSIFGNAGIRIVEKSIDGDGVEYVRSFEIIEFSLTPLQPNSEQS